MKRVPADPLQRERRKQDLLLASQVMRGQIDFSLNAIGDRADLYVARFHRVRDFVQRPAVLYGAGLAGLLMLLRRRPAAAVRAVRGRARRSLTSLLLRYGPLAWRMWGIVAPAVRARTAPRR